MWPIALSILAIGAVVAIRKRGRVEMTREALLKSIATTIAGYRKGEIEEINPAHVERWVNQFDKAVQDAILAEVDNILKIAYFSKERVSKFLSDLIKTKKLSGDNPCEFWKSSSLLRIQSQGHSQSELLDHFDECLKDQCNISLSDCAGTSDTYIYIDDFIFSGNRVQGDIIPWIKDTAKDNSKLHIIVIASHTLGEYFINKNIQAALKESKKNIRTAIWRISALENRLANKNISTVLWPSSLPDDKTLVSYATEQKYPFEARVPTNSFCPKIFTSEGGRQLIERELLMAGHRIRSFCASPSSQMRPLGYSSFGVGFGSLLISYRNCPNNCPLALWWGNSEADRTSPLSKWYPLLPRKTYSQSFEFGPVPDLDDTPF